MIAVAIDEEPTVDLELIGRPQLGMAAALVQCAVERHIKEERGDQLTWLLSHPALTESVVTRLVESSPALLHELGHRTGPPRLLRFLAEKYHYPEAILTVAKNLYTDGDATAAEFQEFLAAHADNEWMLQSLAHLSASSPGKEEALIVCLQDHPRSHEHFVNVQRSRQRAERALSETSPEAMNELFETRDPAVLRGLALNPHAPEPILRELARIEAIKGLREIRGLADEALRRMSNKP